MANQLSFQQIQIKEHRLQLPRWETFWCQEFVATIGFFFGLGKYISKKKQNKDQWCEETHETHVLSVLRNSRLWLCDAMWLWRGGSCKNNEVLGESIGHNSHPLSSSHPTTYVGLHKLYKRFPKTAFTQGCPTNWVHAWYGNISNSTRWLDGWWLIY